MGPQRRVFVYRRDRWYGHDTISEILTNLKSGRHHRLIQAMITPDLNDNCKQKETATRDFPDSR
jgi:hypothetical protein